MEQLSLLQKIYLLGETLSSEELNQIVLYLNSSIEAINSLIAKNNNINEGHCEMRYKVSAQLPEAPESGTDGKSNGWSDTYTKPDTANGEITWMTLSFFNGEGVYGDWSTPVCITWGSVRGQVGPKGESGLKGSFKSRVFKRLNTIPDTPTGGTYDNPIPSEGGWTDGIPTGKAIIWSSVCTFYGNGLSSGWSVPAPESDSDTLDVEFSPNITQPEPPTGNIPFANHESESWYDPSSNNFYNVGTMIWRAERKVSNGEYNGEWTVTRIVGEKGTKGDSGLTGGHYEFRYNNFKSSDQAPAPTKPGNGSNGTTGGWTTFQETLTETLIREGYAIWMTQCYQNENSVYGVWTDPIRITGANGYDGVDGKGIEFVYTRRNTVWDNPTPPPTIQTDDWPTNGNSHSATVNGVTWYDNPLGVTDVLMYEYVSLRLKVDDVWSAYSTPVIWSKWGEKGMDGDGMLYVFKLFSSELTDAQCISNIPIKPDTMTNNEWIPTGWSDNPLSPTSSDPFCYCSIIKKINGTWGNFEKLSLWAKYSKDGSDSTVPGPQGKLGPMSYLAGIWDANTTYTKTETKNPVVYYAPNDSYYYLIGDILPISSTGENPSTSSKWAQAENYNMVFTDILFVNQFAKLGSFIVNEDWMISQYGTIYDSSGIAHIINSDNASWTTSGVTYVGKVSTSGLQPAYSLFDSYHPNRATMGATPGNTPNFIPYAAINAKTGESYFNKAHVTGDIRATSGIFNGIVNATQFKAGDDNGFSITTSPDSLDFNYNGSRLAFFSLRGWDAENEQLADVSDNPTGFYLYLTNPLNGHLVTINFEDLKFKDLNYNQVLRHPVTFYSISNSGGRSSETQVTLYYSLEDNTTKWWAASDATTELTSAQMGTLYKKHTNVEDGYYACVQEVVDDAPYKAVPFTLYEEYTLQNNAPTRTGNYAMTTNLNPDGSSASDNLYVLPSNQQYLNKLNTDWTVLHRPANVGIYDINEISATVVVRSGAGYTVPTFTDSFSAFSGIDANGDPQAILYPVPVLTPNV